VVNDAQCNRKVKESETSDLFERYGVNDVDVNRKESSLRDRECKRVGKGEGCCEINCFVFDAFFDFDPVE
jgi:hypothetical protein